MSFRTYVLVLSLAVIAAAAYAKPQHGVTRLDSPKPAPDFTLKDTQGTTHSLAGYRGKVLVINFWATWCRPCREEMPSLQRAEEQLRDDGIQVLTINMGDTQNDIGIFTGAFPVGELPILMDSDSSVSQAYEVKGLPTTYVLDPEGRIVIQVIGEYEWDSPSILKEVRALKSS